MPPVRNLPPSRRRTQWLCLAASFALVSCGRDSGTALDVRLVLTGSIDQIEVRDLLITEFSEFDNADVYSGRSDVIAVLFEKVM